MVGLVAENHFAADFRRKNADQEWLSMAQISPNRLIIICVHLRESAADFFSVLRVSVVNKNRGGIRVDLR
jgi:hypothetical protein